MGTSRHHASPSAGNTNYAIAGKDRVNIRMCEIVRDCSPERIQQVDYQLQQRPTVPCAFALSHGASGCDLGINLEIDDLLLFTRKLCYLLFVVPYPPDAAFARSHPPEIRRAVARSSEGRFQP